MCSEKSQFVPFRAQSQAQIIPTVHQSARNGTTQNLPDQEHLPHLTQVTAEHWESEKSVMFESKTSDGVSFLWDQTLIMQEIFDVCFNCAWGRLLLALLEHVLPGILGSASSLSIPYESSRESSTSPFPLSAEHSTRRSKRQKKKSKKKRHKSVSPQDQAKEGVRKMVADMGEDRRPCCGETGKSVQDGESVKLGELCTE